MGNGPARILLLLFLAIGTARAQAPSGAIAGIASDSSGAAVPGAPVSVVNRDTGQTRAAITSTCVRTQGLVRE